MKQKRTLKLNYLGRDSWERPVYQAKNGTLYVDVDPLKRFAPNLCTKLNNAFDGEPDTHLSGGVEVEFIPSRDVWY